MIITIMDSQILTLFSQITLWEIKVAFILIFIAWAVFKYIDFGYYRRLPPGPWGVPFLGSLPFMEGNPHSWYLEKSDKYGDIFSLKLGSHLIVCIGSAKLLKELFYRHDSTGRPHTPLNNLLGGLGIVLSEGTLWKKQRQFLHDKLRKLGVKMSPNQRFEKFIIMEIEEFLHSLEKTEGKPIDPAFNIGRHVHNVICQLMMSFRFEKNDEDFKMFNEKVIRGMKLYGSIHYGEYIKYYMKLPGKQAVLKEIQRNLADISKFHMKRIEGRRETRKNTNEIHGPVDLVDHYLDVIEKEKADSATIFPDTNADNQIVQVMNDLFSAGMETTRTSLLWCLVMVAREPTAASKVRQELSKVVNIGQLVTLEHRASLQYIEAFIYETLRIVSVVPLGTTHVNTSPWKVNDYTIPAGAHIIPLINKMNMDPEIYPEPNKFKPERFIKKNGLILSESYMPFGVGQRMCLGSQLARMELFLFFANLMNHFDICVPKGQEVPGLEGVLGSAHAPLPFNMCFKKLEN